MAKDEIKDTLESTQVALVLDLICEGPIEGLKRAAKSGYNEGGEKYRDTMLKDIFLDGTPILKESADVTSLNDSNFNFKNVKLRYRLGTKGQKDINYFDQIQREVNVGIKVTKDGGPVTRTITDESVDAVRVTLTWPVLYRIGKFGEYKPRIVNYKIQVNYNGNKWETIKDVTLEGLSLNQYQRDHNIKLDNARFGSPGQTVDIRVRRVTDDDDNEKDKTEFFWTSYTEKIRAKLTYPFSALIGLEFKAKDFQNIPTRSYFVRGLKVKIPANATVKPNSGRIVYSGGWNGSFAAEKAWTADPAWILYDLLTNERYGVGGQVKEGNLDKFAFYEASQYCNEKVPSMDPDDEDDEEPRFSCNVVLQSARESYAAINDLASVFRAMPYWGAGTLQLTQDRPTSPSFLFNNSNVGEDGFSYSGTSERTRHSIAIVKWFRNKIQNFEYEVVEDTQAYEAFGYRPITIDAIGVRTRGQARRVGEWLLYSENYDTEVVTFKTGLDAGSQVRPGDVIAITDPLRAGVRRGGRVTAFTSTTVDIDEDSFTDVPLGASPTIQISNEDGTLSTYTVTNVSGATITVSGTISPNPLIGGSFIYNDNDQASTEWRVLSITEEELTTYVITALKYNESKYDYIERDRPLEDQTYLPVNSGTTLNGPGALSAVVQEVTFNGVLTTEIIISWTTDPNAVAYEVSVVETGETTSVSSPIFTIRPATFDTYTVSVVSVGPTGSKSPSSSITVDALAAFETPADPLSLSAVQLDEFNATLSWPASTDSFVLSEGSVVVRHSPLLDLTATWSNATELLIVPGSSTTTLAPLLTGTYFIKFLSSSGYYSINAASDTLEIAPAAPEAPVETIVEDNP